MNNNKTLKDLLSEVTVNLTEFRNEFYDILNNNEINEMNFSVSSATEEEFISKRTEEVNKLIKEAEQVLLDNESNTKISQEEKDYIKEKTSAQMEGYKQELEFLEKSKKEQKENKNAHNQEAEAYIESLKEAISKMRKSLNVIEFNGKKVSSVDVLIENVKSQITLIEYRIATLKQEMDKAKGIEKAPFAQEIETLNKKRNKWNGVLNNLESFLEFVNDLDKIEKAAGKGFASETDGELLTNFKEKLEVLTDSFDKSADKSMISINVIANADGSYSLDMRCGNKIADPRPYISADKFNEYTINQYLDGFVYSVSAKTDLSVDDLKNSDILLKTNNKEIGRFKYNEVGKTLENASKDLSNSTTVSNEPPKQTQDGPDAPVKDTPAEPSKDSPVEPGKDAPVDPGKTTPAGQGNDAPANSGKSEPEDKNKKDVFRVAKGRVRESKLWNNKKNLLILATGGLALAGATMGFGLVPAAVAGGLAVTNTVLDMGASFLDNARYKAVIRKLEKIAKRNNVEFEFKPEENICQFVTRGRDGKQEPIVINSQSVSGISDGLLDDINLELAKTFRNKDRGLGSSAVSFYQLSHADLPPVTADNLAAAFVEFGGMLVTKEEASLLSNSEKSDFDKKYQLGDKIFKGIVDRNKQKQDSKDDALEDVSIEELEKATKEEEKGQEPVTPVEPEVPKTPQTPTEPTPVTVEPVTPPVAEQPIPVQVVEEQPVVPKAPVESAEDLAALLDSDIDYFMSHLNDESKAAPAVEEPTESKTKMNEQELYEYYNMFAGMLDNEVLLGQALQNMISEKQVTKEEFEKLQEFDAKKEIFTDELKNEMFGKGLGL